MGKKRPTPLPESMTIVLTGPDLAYLDAYRQAEHDVSYPPAEFQRGKAWIKYEADCKRRSDDALRSLLVALLHQAENSLPAKPE